MSNQPLIHADEISVQFGEHVVLDGVSLDLFGGEIVTVLGRSGCGKSTLLRHLVGLRAPDRGHVYLFGQKLYGMAEDQRVVLLRRIGVLFQSGALFNSLSLEDNVAMPLIEHHHVSPDVALVAARMKLALVGLEKSARLLPGEISGGMKKRAGLARALILDPEVLLLDEPSAGLDPVSARALDDLILNLKRELNVGFIVVTHDLDSIKTIADRAIMLDRGHVLAQGTVPEMRAASDPVVAGFFAREARELSISTNQTVAELLRLSRERAGERGSHR